MTDATVVTADDVEDAARRIAGFVRETPVMVMEAGAFGVPGAITLMLVPTYDPDQPDAPLPRQPFLDAVCRHLSVTHPTVEVTRYDGGPAGVPLQVGVE